jgi:hypothetical protein
MVSTRNQQNVARDFHFPPHVWRLIRGFEKGEEWVFHCYHRSTLQLPHPINSLVLNATSRWSDCNKNIGSRTTYIAEGIKLIHCMICSNPLMWKIHRLQNLARLYFTVYCTLGTVGTGCGPCFNHTSLSTEGMCSECCDGSLELQKDMFDSEIQDREDYEQTWIDFRYTSEYNYSD